MFSKCSLKQGRISAFGMYAKVRKKRMKMRLPKVPVRHAILEQRGLNGIMTTTYFRMKMRSIQLYG